MHCHKIKKISLFILFIFLFSACAPPKDRLKNNLGYKELTKLLEKEQKELFKARQNEIKTLEKKTSLKKIIKPELPEFNPLEETPVSISVRNKPLHDVLYVIARNAGLNLVIEPEIDLDNTVTITFENTPSALVIQKLLEAYDLAWEVKDNVLFVKRYEEKLFDLGFLNIETSVEMNNGGDIFGSASGEGESGLTGNFQISSKYGQGIGQNSLYGYVQQTVASIINTSDSSSSSSTSSTSSSSGGTSSASSTSGEYFTIDPVAGTMLVRTSPRKLKAISEFLLELQKKMQRQVIIDAQILEVQLNDSFRFGIDWQYLGSRIARGTNIQFSFGITGEPGVEPSPLTAIRIQPPGYDKDNPFNSLATTDNTWNVNFIDALQTFGTIKIVSNPHVRARHGQPAMFTCGDTFTYVSKITLPKKKDNNATTDSSNTPTIETARVFSGVLLGVIPFIKDKQEASLQIFPIKSYVDPESVNLQEVIKGTGTQISLPKVTIKNVSTNVKVHNNDIVILGGLIDKVTSKSDSEVPGLGRIPLLGWLFKGKNDTEIVRELVIIMRIKII